MINRSLVLCLALGLLSQAVTANAAIIQTFGNRIMFQAAVPGLDSVSLALPGVAPVIVPEFVTGQLTITAVDGQLAGDGLDLISTELDNDVLVLSFVRPVSAIGFLGGVVNEAFGFVDGELNIEAVGSGATTFSAIGGPAYLGLLTDTRFSQVRISIISFDSDATSVAFVGLIGQIDSAVPEPATWLLMLTSFSLVGSRLRHKRRRMTSACN